MMTKSTVLNTLRGYGIQSDRELAMALMDNGLLYAVGFGPEDKPAIDELFNEVSRRILRWKLQ